MNQAVTHSIDRKVFTSRAVRAILLDVIVAAALAAGAVAQAAAVDAAHPVWPAPPDAPRVLYVGSITQPAEAGARLSGSRRFANWISGASKGNEALARPFGIAADDSGNLYLTDTGANTVSFYDERKKQWHSWDHVGKIRFSAPVGIAAKDKTLFVADSGLGRVIVFDTGGTLRFQIDHDLGRPAGLVVRGDRLWVADSQQHCVAIFDLHGKFLSRFGKRGVGPGEFNFPTHLATDDRGRLYVTDSMNNRVQVFDDAGRFLSQIGAAGDGPGYFSRPKGVAVDSFGHVYVVDALFGNVQIFDGTGRLLLDWGGPGSGAGEFYLPNGIAIGRDHQIFVADGFNHRVQVFKYVGEK